MKLNKGGMFGLDARIALAVFSILGLLGSYYSLNYMDDAYNKNVVEQIKTLRQAVMQNLADNGYDYTIDDTNLNSNVFGIKTNTTNLNRGNNNYSYVNNSNTDSTGTKILIDTAYRVLEVTTNNIYSSDLATGEDYKTTDCAATLVNCFYWFKIDNATQEAFEILDKYYDATTGTFADTASVETGIIVAPTIDSANNTAVVLVKIGER
jgi:type II secretory pathway pseudopilin PulG